MMKTKAANRASDESQAEGWSAKMAALEDYWRIKMAETRSEYETMRADLEGEHEGTLRGRSDWSGRWADGPAYSGIVR